MTGSYSLRTACKRTVVGLACLWLLVAPAVAGVAVTQSQGTTPASTAATVDTTASALAGSTTVRLDPTTATVDEGSTRTLAVVVSDADNGVGAVSGRLSVVESEHAEIVDFQFRGDPGVENVSITGDSVSFEGALLDTPQTGTVTVAEVTVRGQLEGRTDLALSIDSLGDEAGAPYDVGGTPDTALTVENTRNQVPLSITTDTERAASGESVTFTVMRTDSNARVEATVTVGNRTVNTGVDGEATVVVRDSMAGDAGTITAVASKGATSQEQYTNDSVTLAYDDSDDSTRSDGTDSATSGAIVRTEPGSVDVSLGQTTTVDVVVANIEGGVGAAELQIAVGDASIAEVTAASVVGDPGIGGAEIRDGGASVDAQFALRDGPDDAPVRIVTLTLRGVSTGSTPLSLSVSSVGNTNGTSYAVAATPDGSIDVRSGTDTVTTTASDGTDETADQQSTDSDQSGTTVTDDGQDDDGTTTQADTETGATGQTGTGSTDSSVSADSPLIGLVALGAVVFLLGLLAVAAS